MENVQLFETWQRLGEVLPAFLVRSGTAVLCGAIVGLERELKAKPAGFRTNILICLGASMYMAIGLLVTDATGDRSDPSRIAAQVVTGIGFIGAGCILQERGRVTGLTTAATIWVVAAIGIVAGAGYPLIAFVSTGLVGLTLVGLGVFERRFLDQGPGE